MRKTTPILLLLLLACAGVTERDPKTEFLAARKAWIVALDGYAEVLKESERQVDLGNKPLIDTNTRIAATALTREALTIFEEVEPLLDKPGFRDKIFVAVRRINTLTLQLAAVYAMREER